MQKRLIFILSTALVLLAFIFAYYYINTNNKFNNEKNIVWDSQKIKTEFKGLEVQFEDNMVLQFRYSVTSSLLTDYSLPLDEYEIYVELPNAEGLQPANNVTFPTNMFLPAGQKISLIFTAKYPYNESKYTKDELINDVDKLNKFMKSKFSEFKGFVILDKKNRYEIRFSTKSITFQ